MCLAILALVLIGLVYVVASGKIGSKTEDAESCAERRLNGRLATRWLRPHQRSTSPCRPD